MNQQQYIIAKFKAQIADLTEKLYALDFRCIQLQQENEQLHQKISELENSEVVADAESIHEN